MKIKAKQVIDSIREVIGNRKYFAGFLLVSVLLFGVFVYAPVLLTPGSTLLYQLQVYSLLNFVLFGVLALLLSMILTMQVYIYKRRKSLGVGSTALSGSAGLFGAVVGTATCPLCLAPIVAIFGAGAVIFLLKYQSYFVGAAILLMLFSLYYTSKGVSGVCRNC